jgi:hypothetical protein
MTSSFYRPPIKDITITSSIGRKSSSLYFGQTTPYQSTDFESFPIEAISSSTAGVFPDLHGNISSSNYYINITQSWSSSFLGPLGSIPILNNDQKEFYNGELSGSNLTISDQRLIDEDCIKFLEIDIVGNSYTAQFFYGGNYPFSPVYAGYSNMCSIMTINEFINEYVVPPSGTIYLYSSAESNRNIIEQTSIVDPSGKTLIGNGILFIKIPRIDNDGSDNTLSLQELKQIRIKFLDTYGYFVPLAPTSPFRYDYTKYDVLSISEYPDYYLYLINPKNVMSISSNRIDNYSFSGSQAGGAVAFRSPFIAAYSATASNPSSYMDAGTGIYTFGNTPNVGLQISASLTASATGVYLAFVQYPNNYINGGYYNIIAEAVSTGSQPIKISFPWGNYLTPTSSYPIRGEEYGIILDKITSGLASYTDLRLNMLQLEVPSSSAPSVTVFNPTLTTTFTNTDCDVTMNNAIEDRVSNFYQQVEYSNFNTTPSNYQAVISRSATFAQVNDFNYYSTPRALAKYQGAKLVSSKLNFYSSSDIGPVNSPNVQLLENYFLYFDWIGDTSPDIMGSSVAHIRALIDIDGNIYEPSDVGMYFDNYVRTFSKGDHVNVIIRAADNSYPSNGLKRILYPYNFPLPVIASQTGSRPTKAVSLSSIAFYKKPEYYTTVIDYFENNSIPNFQSLFTASAGSSVRSHALPANYTQFTLGGSEYINGAAISGSHNIIFTSLNNQTRVKLTAILDQCFIFDSGNTAGHDNYINPTVITFRVQIKEFPIGQPYGYPAAKVIAQGDFNIYGSNQSRWVPSSENPSGTTFYPAPSSYSISTDFIYMDTSKAYSVVFKITQLISAGGSKYTDSDYFGKFTYDSNLTDTAQAYLKTLLGNAGVTIKGFKLKVEQENGPSVTGFTTASYNVANSLYYWTTASNNTNLLSGPQFTYNIYKQTYGGALFQSWTPSGSEKNAGYGDYMPFQIYPGDQIRFEGDESQVYDITEVYPPSSNSPLQIRLDRNVPSTTQINSFLVRRLETNPSMVVLDWNGTGYKGGGGFIVPQYMAKRGSSMDFNKVITNLKEKGIVPS